MQLLVSGNFNTVTVNGRYTNIEVSGNPNQANAQNTTLLSTQNIGNGNTINP
jgi:hypothetical protein